MDDVREDDGDENHEDDDASQGYPSSPDIPRRVITVAILVHVVTTFIKSVLRS